MNNKYREKGKEYGFTHKADYLGIVLLSSIFPILLVYILYLLRNYFMFDIIVNDVGSMLISIDNCFIVYSILSSVSIIRIPLAYFGKSMLENPDETFSKRIVMSFKRLTVKNSLGIITSTLITVLPLMIMSALFYVFVLFEELTTGDLTFAIAVLATSLYVLTVCINVVQFSINLSNYLLVPYLLGDDPQLSGKAARSKSKELMLGYRFDFIELVTEFLCLGNISIFLIVPIIYFIPYVYATTIYFAVERLTNKQPEVTEDSDSLIVV